MAKITKINMLIAESLKISEEYEIIMTLRQIYYRLVARKIIENTKSNYKYLSKALVQGRKNGTFPYKSMEDRTRSVKNFAKQWYLSPNEEFDFFLEKISEEEFTMPINLYQKKVVIVALEKEALASIFEKVVAHFGNCILIVCRGFNSLTQMHELSEVLLELDKEVHCVFFSDFDPSGISIQNNFEKQMNELGIYFESFQRIALTQEQIDLYELPSVPAKTSDSRSKDWVGGVVELDALEPPVLEKMIRDSIKPFWDYRLSKEVRRLREVLKQRYERLLKPLKEAIRNEGYEI